MTTVTYDDGSTLSYDDTGVTGSTQSPPGYLVSDYGSNISPGNSASGASTWADVLKFGFGRVVDYKTASLQSANTPPVYAAPPVYQPTKMSGQTLLLIGGAILLFVMLSSDGKKG